MLFLLFLTFTTHRYVACNVISHVLPIEMLRAGFFGSIDSWVTKSVVISLHNSFLPSLWNHDPILVT